MENESQISMPRKAGRPKLRDSKIRVYVYVYLEQVEFELLQKSEAHQKISLSSFNRFKLHDYVNLDGK